VDESLQQIIAIAIVAIVVSLELLRRYQKKRSRKAGCDGCDTGNKTTTNEQGETPIKFYKRR